MATRKERLEDALRDLDHASSEAASFLVGGAEKRVEIARSEALAILAEAEAENTQRLRKGAFALCYTQALPTLQRIAREHGYALAVHGSMHTDLDLIACPWTEEASDAETLIEALRSSFNGEVRDHEKEGVPRIRPHGRRAWPIFTSWGEPYLDVSVMPRNQDRLDGRS